MCAAVVYFKPTRARIYPYLIHTPNAQLKKMGRPKKTTKRTKQRRGSLEYLRDAVAPSINKTARYAAKKTKKVWEIAIEVLKGSVGEGPAVIHIHPPSQRRGSRYSEVDALYHDGWRQVLHLFDSCTSLTDLSE